MEKQIGNFKFIETSIKDVVIIEPKKYGDNRGYFMETYKKADFDEDGLVYDFVQDNQSKSKAGVLRGLHFQKKFPQAKLVRCIEGEVFDVCVDFLILTADTTNVSAVFLCKRKPRHSGVVQKRLCR